MPKLLADKLFRYSRNMIYKTSVSIVKKFTRKGNKVSYCIVRPPIDSFLPKSDLI